MQTAEVVIVGAGPAGSTLAYRLASAGVDTLVLERETLPRIKPCGGGVVKSFIDNLPRGMNIDSVIEDWTKTAIITRRGGAEVEIPLDPPIAQVTRSRMDHYLMNQAVAKGARLVQGSRVAMINWTNGNQSTFTADEEYRSKVLVGADGAYSTVARLAKLIPQRRSTIALELDVSAKREVIEEWRGKLLIEFSPHPPGYGWIFPKRRGRYLNVGFGVPFKKATSVTPLVEDLLERKGLHHPGIMKRTHLIPTASSGSQVVSERTLLVGDAAGLVDPATDEGLSWALRSSKMAAGPIISSLGSGPSLLYVYQEAYEEMIEEFRFSKALRNILFGKLALTGKLSPTLLDWVFRVTAGQATYSEWGNSKPFLYRIGSLLETIVAKWVT